MVPRGDIGGFLKWLNGQNILVVQFFRACAPGGCMLQSVPLPGTSTPCPMQGDGTVREMTQTMRISARSLSRGLLSGGLGARNFGARLRAAGAIAVTCLMLGACTGEQFQKGYIMPPGALEQIPIGASQDQVLIVMGTPATVGTLDGA